MNDPKAQPIDIEEQRAWLIEHKKDTGLSYAQIASRLGPEINKTSLSLFAGAKYNAPEDRFAEAIFRFRQTLAAQMALRVESPNIPSYFPTPTSTQILGLLQFAQRGRVTVGALASGLGKTIAVKHFRRCNTNVFYVKIAPSTSSIFGMQKAVLRALGVAGASGSPEALSRRIMDRLFSLTNPLLVFDEAQHLTVKAIEEIRSWYDDTDDDDESLARVGISFFGDKRLLPQLEGANRSDLFAQIFSRISLRMVRLQALDGDIDALLEAWGVEDEKVVQEIHPIAKRPGALRNATWTLELATMLARGGKEELVVGHVQDAWAQLSSRSVAA